MAYDVKLATRLRRALSTCPEVEEKSMFGGLAFMVRGHMCCGLVQSKLMVRVDPETYDRWLEEPHAEEMTFTGRPTRGFLYVNPPGIATPAALRKWVGRALTFVDHLPPKRRPARPRRIAQR